MKNIWKITILLQLERGGCANKNNRTTQNPTWKMGAAYNTHTKNPVQHTHTHKMSQSFENCLRKHHFVQLHWLSYSVDVCYVHIASDKYAVSKCSSTVEKSVNSLPLSNPAKLFLNLAVAWNSLNWEKGIEIYLQSNAIAFEPSRNGHMKYDRSFFDCCSLKQYPRKAIQFHFSVRSLIQFIHVKVAENHTFALRVCAI